MTIPTIQEIAEAAVHMIILAGKTSPQYKLTVWQQQVTQFRNEHQSVAMWHIEYAAISFRQPYITVSGVTGNAVLKRFAEELAPFEPVSISEIENALIPQE